MWIYYALLLVGLMLPTAGRADPSAPVTPATAPAPVPTIRSGPPAVTELPDRPAIDAAIDPLLPLLSARTTPEVNRELERAFKRFYAAGSDPILLDVLKQRVAALESRRRALEASSALPQPASAPRKRDLEASAEGLRTVETVKADPVRTLEEWTERRTAYGRLLGALGDHAHGTGLLTTAFRAYAAAIVLIPDHWTEASGRNVRYLDAATFMVLSAHQFDEVLALYRVVPLDRNPLDRAVVTQIDRWLTLYAQAPTDLTSYSGIQQALGDLLYVLIEDPAAVSILPEADRRRLLERLAEAALERQHYAEAVGAYARLGDRKALQRLGRQLSRAVIIETESVLLVQREVDLAIDALAEAGDTEALKQLLLACREAQARVDRGDKHALNPESLRLYIRHLETLVGQGKAEDGLLVDGKQSGARRSESESRTRAIPNERLAELITLYANRSLTAVGAERREVTDMLKTLQEEAGSRGRLDLAVQAAAARDGAGLELVGLGDRCVQVKEWTLALNAYRAAGTQGMSGLRALGDQLTVGRPVAPKGALDPLIPIAVDAWLAADAVDRLEPLYNALVDARSDLAQHGRLTTQEGANLDAVIRRIEAAYELVPRGTREVARAPSKSPTPRKSRKNGGHH